MDNGQCNIIYFDTRAHTESTVTASQDALSPPPTAENPKDSLHALDESEVSKNIATILTVFPEVHLCTTSSSTIARLNSFDGQGTARPTAILIQTSYHDPSPQGRRPDDDRRSPSPGTALEVAPPATRPSELCGFDFLQYLDEEINKRSLSRLCLPVIVVSGPKPGKGVLSSASSDTLRGRSPFPDFPSADASFGPSRFLDAGAADVMTSPLSRDRILSLCSLAYHASKDSTRRASLWGPNADRKLSWCGIDQDTRPYAYLREAMVSGLMNGITNPDYVDQSVNPAHYHIHPTRAQAVADAIGTWSFSAHELDEDELLYAAFCMLRHTLQMPGLEEWHLRDDQLLSFLLATRKVYNSFVLYHNFRHACDVTQALFYFLIQLGAIPPYYSAKQAEPVPRAPLTALLEPFHALTMIIAAIGHDVGHPGVNNLFLVKLNAPLAQLYSDRSVLECFHCAAYTQILRRYWPNAFSHADMRKFMINVILATDMGVHAQYMDRLKELQQAVAENPRVVDAFDEKKIYDHRDLLCCLLIKCADICNAARPIDVATRWAAILIDEFANQGEMEKELNMPTCLFGGPPVRNDMKQTAMSQIGFMEMFAGPLFAGMATLFPTMHFGIDEIHKNKGIWKSRAEMTNAPVDPKRASLTGLEQKPSRWTNTNMDGYQINAPGKRKSDSAAVTLGSLSFKKQPSLQSGKTGATHHPSPPSSRKSSGGHSSHFQGLPQFNFDPHRRSSWGPTVLPQSHNNSSAPNSRRGSAQTGSPRFYGAAKEASTTYADAMKQVDGTGPTAEGRPPPPPTSRPSAEDAVNKNLRRGPLPSPQPDDKKCWSEKDEASTSVAAAGSDQTWASSASSAGPDRGRKKKSASPFGSLKFWKRRSRSVDSEMHTGCGPPHGARGKRASLSAKSGPGWGST